MFGVGLGTDFQNMGFNYMASRDNSIELAINDFVRQKQAGIDINDTIDTTLNRYGLRYKDLSKVECERIEAAVNAR